MTMTALTITSWAAAFLTVFYIVISMRVGLARNKNRISLGDGNVKEMTILIRAHGNFAEYVPLALVLLMLCELKAANYQAIMIAAILLCIGRVIHYFGLTKGQLPFRIAGMLGTMASLLILAISLICALN